MLRLNNNLLTGSIPEDIRYLSHLVELDLSNNAFTGQMTPYYWLSDRMTKLASLNLSNNRLDFPPLFGEFESSTGHSNDHEDQDDHNEREDHEDQDDDYDHEDPNGHDGPRRISIKGENSLLRLVLGGNKGNCSDNGNGNGNDSDSATIVLPNEFRQLTNLRELSLENLGLGGKIPAWLFHDLPELRVLNLSHNHLTGTIVNPLPGVSSGNGIGIGIEIPSSSLPLSHLKALLLHENAALAGNLPEFVGLLPQLSTLTLHHTDITVGIEAANLICWRDAGNLESLTTDCGDTTCPCCYETCCNTEDCYMDVDWESNGGSPTDTQHGK